MSSQHFHDKALFLRDFRNLALEGSVISGELLSPETVAGLQPVAVMFPSQGAAAAQSEVAPSRMQEQRRRRNPISRCGGISHRLCIPSHAQENTSILDLKSIVSIIPIQGHCHSFPWLPGLRGCCISCWDTEQQGQKSLAFLLPS